IRRPHHVAVNEKGDEVKANLILLISGPDLLTEDLARPALQGKPTSLRTLNGGIEAIFHFLDHIWDPAGPRFPQDETKFGVPFEDSVAEEPGEGLVKANARVTNSHSEGAGAFLLGRLLR